MESEKIIGKVRQFALAEIEKHGLPSQLNWETSNTKGQEIAEKLNVDKDVVLLGTMLMDLKLGEAVRGAKKTKEHVAMSANTAQEILAEFNLPVEKKKKIINCIEAHHKDVPFVCKEAEICANADCYRFILPRNVFEFIADLRKEGMTIEKAINFAYFKLEEKHNILSLDICKEELEQHYKTFKKIFESINAKPEGR